MIAGARRAHPVAGGGARGAQAGGHLQSSRNDPGSRTGWRRRRAKACARYASYGLHDRHVLSVLVSTLDEVREQVATLLEDYTQDELDAAGGT